MVKKSEEKVTRTEEEIVAQAPITVILGGKPYEIAPLVIRDSRAWRKKYVEFTAPIFGMLNATMEEMDFPAILMQMMVEKPDQVIDLFFEYAKNLNREEIEGSATDSELAVAFGEVVKMALPLAESLPKTMSRLTG